MKSVCFECVHCEAVEITDGLTEFECEEGMTSFGLDEDCEGCWMYEERQLSPKESERFG